MNHQHPVERAESPSHGSESPSGPLASSEAPNGPHADAQAIASCPGYETVPNPCRCPCYGCRHHCGAHNPADRPASSAQSAPERPAPLSATDGPAPTPPEPHTGAQPPVPNVLHAALMRAGLTTQDARDEAARLTAEVRTAALNEAAAAADRIATAHREGEHGEEMTSREVRDAIETVAAELRTLTTARPDDTTGDPR